MDVDQRKRLFGEQLLANIPLAAHIKRVLDERPTPSRAGDAASARSSRTTCPRTTPSARCRAIINLGRYGELFAYDENAQTFSYENPQ